MKCQCANEPFTIFADLFCFMPRNPGIWSGPWARPTTCSPSKCHAVSCLLFLFPRMLFSGMLLSFVPMKNSSLSSKTQFGRLPLEPFPASQGLSCVDHTAPQTQLHVTIYLTPKAICLHTFWVNSSSWKNMSICPACSTA